MEKKESKFKNLLNKLFGDNKKRHLYTVLVILPFLIIIIVCGVLIYKEAKGLINLASSETGSEAVSDSYSIKDGMFVLRDTATDIQKEYFKELKDMYENPSAELTDMDKAVSTVKNYVADFYTFSNKQGQYDVGGMYYVYEPQRSTVYIQARDQFYKYINNYMDDYGSENLLEVAAVEATPVGSEFEFDFDEQEFSAYKVNATWSYVEKEGVFSTSKYDTKAYFVVINNNERFEIIYAGNEEYQQNAE